MSIWERVGVSIRTVPSQREGMALALLRRVQTFAPHVKLSAHGSGRTVPESYADALSAWEGAGHAWVLQLEDDAILAPDFEAHAGRMLEAVNDTRIGLVSFYSGRRLRDGEHLPERVDMEQLPGAKFLMAQGFAMPSQLVPDHNAFMLDFTSREQRPYATDTATAAWMKARKLRYLRAWPSIVQHDEVDSLCGHHRNPNRTSQSYRARYGETGGR